MLEMMDYMYNNIEILNKWDLFTNKYSGNKSDYNKQRLTPPPLKYTYYYDKQQKIPNIAV